MTEYQEIIKHISNDIDLEYKLNRYTIKKIAYDILSDALDTTNMEDLFYSTIKEFVNDIKLDDFAKAKIENNLYKLNKKKLTNKLKKAIKNCTFFKSIDLNYSITVPKKSNTRIVKLILRTLSKTIKERLLHNHEVVIPKIGKLYIKDKKLGINHISNSCRIIKRIKFEPYRSLKDDINEI